MVYFFYSSKITIFSKEKVIFLLRSDKSVVPTGYRSGVRYESAIFVMLMVDGIFYDLTETVMFAENRVKWQRPHHVTKSQLLTKRKEMNVERKNTKNTGIETVEEKYNV